jgi:callose synthase
MAAPGGRRPDFSSPGTSSAGGAGRRRLLRTQTVGNMGESIFDSEVLPSSLVEIAPILRVANEVDAGNPRVAYLCKPSTLPSLQSNLAPTHSGLVTCYCFR